MHILVTIITYIDKIVNIQLYIHSYNMKEY